MPTKTFMLNSTGYVRIYLRRYHSSSDDTNKCPGKYGYHNAQNLIAKEKSRYRKLEAGKHSYTVLVNKGSKYKKEYPHYHSKWPAICDYCGYEFDNGKEDVYQVFVEVEYEREDTGEKFALNDVPPGAMYYAWWLKDNPFYPDTGPLYAVCPGGHPWNIDGRASNCGLPDDNEHKCWIRHGEPPEITVDKNGKTCQAGAGSIATGNYHGFLRNGYFTDNM